MDKGGPTGPGWRERPGNVTTDFCYVDTALHSAGIWGSSAGSRGFLDYALPRLQLQLAIIFIITQSLHLLLRRFHLPRLVSEILAGIILGPTILGQFGEVEQALFPQEGDVYLDLLSKIGYIFFIFLSGVKMDPRTVLRTGIKAWTIGVLAVTLPLGGSLIMTVVQQTEIHKYRIPAYKNTISIQNLFPFPVIASMLVDLKIMNSELGRLALASALISDLVSNLASTAITYGRVGIMSFANVIMIHSTFLTVCLILFILCVGRPLSLWIISKTPEGKPVSRFHVILMSFLVLVVVLLTDNVGLNYQYGPFLLGLAVPDGPPLGSTMVDRLETLVSGLLAPLLVTYCGMNVNLVELFDLQFVSIVWTVVGLCLVMKLLSVFVPAVICRVPVKDAVALAFIMSAQGVVQMSFYYYNYVNQTFDGETFSMLTTSVLIQSAASSLIVKSLYDYSRMYTGYQKRDIQHTPTNSELRMLVCAHRVDDAVAIRRVLEASFPSKESPLAVYALHLVELAGRAHPQLIDHQLGQKSSGGGSRTQKMIEVLSAFEQQYTGVASVQQFTAMSLMKFMHHDICTVAFNKLASLIILPFHRKWNHQGKVIMDSSTLRSINCEVLELAPCSVAVLVDRHKVRRSASAAYNVGVAFFGGADDREALAYARRMALSPDVSLTVVRLVPWDIYAGDSQWDAVLDAEILKDTRMQGAHQDNIVYREERVKDGAETALLIHAMEEAFDLIMVGRRHKEDTPQLLGLSEWNDLPELGPVGDMLAAPDLTVPVSVLVVQHQNIKSI
ncbi:cation/H(+) antiporter 15-like [Salvia miltiorrhiza]|uniref:cation/H(+) antiporter 15-like n=1 Tax=Salvia miltiorrhiza TaxID=226208 RepID=UPI0025AC73AF|nr:cation/H(+) antiporter 15-like [Salvia miltiorrhiza]